jgi:hypothetical protein
MMRSSVACRNIPIELIDLICLWNVLAGTGSRSVSTRRLRRKAGEKGHSEPWAVTSRRLFLCALHVSSALVEDDVSYLALVVLKELHFCVHDFQEEFRF